MADSNEPSPTAAKKKGEHLLDQPKRLKSDNPFGSQPNSTWVSSSASGAHDPGPGNDVENADPTASGKCICAILVLSTTTQPLAQPASTNPQTHVSNWNANASEGPRVRLLSTSHQGSSSMFHNIKNMMINDGIFMIENNKVLVIYVSWLVTYSNQLNRKRTWSVCVRPRRLTTELFSKNWP